MELKVGEPLTADQLVGLYDAVGWAAYTRDPAKLAEAVANATYVVTAWEADRLIGLVRGLSDDVSIFYVQDILVHPDWQGQGIGRVLLDNCLKRFTSGRPFC